jgi:hypothetical protein
MHVLHRPHLPRLTSASLAAAVIAIVISLAFAAGTSNISQPANGMSVSAHRTGPAPSGSVLQTTMPPWVSDPLASLVSWPLPQPWLTARP